MGCLVSRSTFEPLQENLAAKNKKIAEYTNQLTKLERLEVTSQELHDSITKELHITLSNYRCLTKYFPLENAFHETLLNKLATFSCSNFTEQAYIYLKLQENDTIKDISDQFIKLVYKLKQIDLLVSKKITDKALSVEKIIKQPAYIDLAP